MDEQTESHNLAIYQCLWLATCFGFWKTIIRQLKISVKEFNLSTTH
jgi:hypothetical protein